MRLNQDGSLSSRAADSPGGKLFDRPRGRGCRRQGRPQLRASYEIPAKFAPYYSDWKILNIQFDPSV